MGHASHQCVTAEQDSGQAHGRMQFYHGVLQPARPRPVVSPFHTSSYPPQRLAENVGEVFDEKGWQDCISRWGLASGHAEEQTSEGTSMVGVELICSKLKR
jgi:hypothetical protein